LAGWKPALQSMSFCIFLIFRETASLSLVKGDWKSALLLLEEGDFGVRGPVFIDVVYHGTYVPANDEMVARKQANGRGEGVR